MEWNRYHAVVVDNKDPDKKGRVRIECGDLLAPGTAWPTWVPPAQWSWSNTQRAEFGCGWFQVPEIGSVVIIEVLTRMRSDRVINESLVMNPNIHYYSATFNDNGPPDTVFTGGKYPDVRGLRTPSGHLLVFDDSDGDEIITLTHKNEETYMTMLANGTCHIQAGNGSYITMLKDGTITIHAPHIKLDNAATQALVRGNDLKTWLDNYILQVFNTHIHLTGVGPSSVPTIPATVLPSTALSANHKVD